jgi:hypothetical protein
MGTRSNVNHGKAIAQAIATILRGGTMETTETTLLLPANHGKAHATATTTPTIIEGLQHIKHPVVSHGTSAVPTTIQTTISTTQLRSKPPQPSLSAVMVSLKLTVNPSVM